MLIPRNPSPSTHRRHGRPVVALGLLQQHQILQIDALRPTVSVRIHAPIPRPEILPKHQGRGPIKDVGIDRLGGVFLSEEFEVGDPFVLLLEGLDDVGAAGARGGEGEVMVRGRAVVDGWYVVAWIGYVKVIVVVIVVLAIVANIFSCVFLIVFRKLLPRGIVLLIPLLRRNLQLLLVRPVFVFFLAQLLLRRSKTFPLFLQFGRLGLSLRQFGRLASTAVVDGDLDSIPSRFDGPRRAPFDAIATIPVPVPANIRRDDGRGRIRREERTVVAASRDPIGVENERDAEHAQEEGDSKCLFGGKVAIVAILVGGQGRVGRVFSAVGDVVAMASLGVLVVLVVVVVVVAVECISISFILVVFGSVIRTFSCCINSGSDSITRLLQRQKAAHLLHARNQIRPLLQRDQSLLRHLQDRPVRQADQVMRRVRPLVDLAGIVLHFGRLPFGDGLGEDVAVVGEEKEEVVVFADQGGEGVVDERAGVGVHGGFLLFIKYIY
mmetsp:Transcript_15957/g.30555  ORF Transcript_15957/g.30555 Transcript_15957/m.30555 type:complete len:494 (+) Transcript_15957:1309-2790(+)